MRTKNYWRTVICLMVVALTASCSHDDWHDYGFPENGLPDYSYFRTGWDEASLKVDSSSTERIAFSYQSWAEAATVRSAKTVLKASLENVNTEILVNDFIIGDAQSSIDYQTVQSRHERDITVTDSLMLYRVRYRHFTLEYRMPFQSAFYNDGKTTGQMAHLRFDSDIVDNGYVVSDLESEIADGSVFMRKLFRHSIVVRFNGKDYQATATIVLKRRAGNENDDFVVKSTLVDSGIKDIANLDNHASYTSWIKVKQAFNSGKEETVTFEVLMYGMMSLKPLTDMKITGKTLSRESAGFDALLEHVQTISRNKYVDALYYERPYVVRYNFGTTTTIFQHVEAVYNDGFVIIEFPSIKYREIKDAGKLELISEKEDEHGSYGEYVFSQSVDAKFDAFTHTEKGRVQAIVIN